MLVYQGAFRGCTLLNGIAHCCSTPGLFMVGREHKQSSSFKIVNSVQQLNCSVKKQINNGYDMYM